MVSNQLEQLNAGLKEISDLSISSGPEAMVDLPDGDRAVKLEVVGRYQKLVKNQTFRLIDLVETMALEARDSSAVKNPELEKLAAEILSTRADIRAPEQAWQLAEAFLAYRNGKRREQ